MKINKIYISAFGKLKDFTIELSDGLNVIYGNNEDGKSTVAAFIKAMFYGTGRSSKNLSESTRQKYTPWNGSTMAGRIYFEESGKKYCLEREFRKSDSTDRIELFDLDSGKQINVGDNVGQHFFGMSLPTFERSLFIGNGDFIKDDTAAGEINGKLSNIAVTGSEDVSYKKIEKNIFDARAKLISKSGRSGSYNEDLQNLQALEERLKVADRDAKAKALLHEKATAKIKEREELTKTQASLKEKLNLKQDFENREKLTEFLNTKKELDILNNSLTLNDGTVVNEAFAQKVEFGINKYQKCEERVTQIKNDIKQLQETIDLQNQSSPENAKAQIDELTAKVDNLTQQKAQLQSTEEILINKVDELKIKLKDVQNKKSKINLPLLIISIILSALGVMCVAISPIITISLIAVAAVLLILSFVIKPKNTAVITATQAELAAANNAVANSVADKNRLQEEINNLNARINTLSSVLHADAAVKAQRLADLNEKINVLNTESEKLNAAKAELMKLVSGFDNVDSIEKVNDLCVQLKQKTAQQKTLKLQLSTASKYLGKIDYSDAAKKLESINQGAVLDNIDFDAVEAEYQVLTDSLSLLKDQITAIATELQTSFRRSENPEDLKREIAELQAKLKSKKEFCDSADLALAVLEESFYELRRGYGSELETLTHSIFSELTDGKYKSVSVSDTLDLSVEKSDVFGTREIGYLSLGTTHQAYLSLRLAIASLISDKNNPLPIFLDDSLSQYDDTRTEKTIKYLKGFCDSHQGVLFTCHSSVCGIAKNQGVTILKPYGEC